MEYCTWKSTKHNIQNLQVENCFKNHSKWIKKLEILARNEMIYKCVNSKSRFIQSNVLQKSGSYFQVQAKIVESLNHLHESILQNLMWFLNMCVNIDLSPKKTCLIFLQFCKTFNITIDFNNSTFKLLNWLENSDLEFRKSKLIAKWQRR